jgi:hypothetical protein
MDALRELLSGHGGFLPARLHERVLDFHERPEPLADVAGRDADGDSLRQKEDISGTAQTLANERNGGFPALGGTQWRSEE